jgi:hypothetical protein
MIKNFLQRIQSIAEKGTEQAKLDNPDYFQKVNIFNQKYSFNKSTFNLVFTTC